MSAGEPTPANRPVSVFRRVTAKAPELSPVEKRRSLLMAIALACTIVIAVIGIWSVWIGALRNQPPEPVEVSYDPYDNELQP